MCQSPSVILPSVAMANSMELLPTILPTTLNLQMTTLMTADRVSERLPYQKRKKRRSISVEMYIVETSNEMPLVDLFV